FDAPTTKSSAIRQSTSGMASTSGLPTVGRRVCASPPLDASSARRGSAPDGVSLGFASPHESSSEDVYPAEAVTSSGPFFAASKQFGPPRGSAITEPKVSSSDSPSSWNRTLPTGTSAAPELAHPSSDVTPPRLPTTVE